MHVFWRCEPPFTTMFLKALSTPTIVEISRLRGCLGMDAQEVPKTVTVAKQQPINCFTDLLRSEMAMAGFTEVLTFILGSTQDNFDTVNRSAEVETAARISNAKTMEFEVCAAPTGSPQIPVSCFSSRKLNVGLETWL